jgi:hypothetical protein
VRLSPLGMSAGRAIAQAVSRWLPTAAARLQTRVWSSGICGGQRWTKWCCGRFSPSTSVSPANLHSTNFSIIIITRGGYSRPLSGRCAEWTQLGLHPPTMVCRPLIGLLYQPWMIDDDECGAVGGMRIGRKKPAPVSLCPPQIPHDRTWARTWATTVESQWLTAWAMAQPTSYVHVSLTIAKVHLSIFSTLSLPNGMLQKNWLAIFPVLSHQEEHLLSLQILPMLCCLENSGTDRLWWLYIQSAQERHDETESSYTEKYLLCRGNSLIIQ